MSKVLAIDMGGTKIAFGIVENDKVLKKIKVQVPKWASKDDLLAFFTETIDQLMIPELSAIGIGVPGLVDNKTGVIYDLLNVPVWDEVPLGQYLMTKYGRPVYIDNDANCFALAEYYRGNHHSTELVGLTLGTGLGAGVISNGQLVRGASGGAGEFGMIPYLDHFLEYYASGQFFENVHSVQGTDVYARAIKGEQEALDMYKSLGHHIGDAIRIIRLAVDPEMIVLAGAVTDAFDYFKDAMREQLSKHPFLSAMKTIDIKVSTLENAPLLGASYLCKTR